MLPGWWFDQARKAGTIKVLQGATTVGALKDVEVQQQVSVLRTTQFCCYAGSDDRWCRSFQVGGKINAMNVEKRRKRSSGIK